MPIDPIKRERAKSAIESWEFRNPQYSLDDSRMKSYVERILPLELDCVASDKDETSRLPEENKQGGILVLMVGFSLDPILQSICAYRPKEVLLILNARYGEKPDGYSGKEFGERKVSRAIARLGDMPDENWKVIITSPDQIVLEKDQPTDVFRALRQKLIPRLKLGERIILDITGGKKSMIAGAFLFGAFAGVDISYVDFDEYDYEHRAPLSYTSRIGLLPNPYEKFRLRDWERVRVLYERYSFRAVRELLGTTDDPNVAEAKQKPGLIDDMDGWFDNELDIPAAKALRNVMAIYERWDNGDYVGSLKSYNKVKSLLKDSSKLVLPAAVEELGQKEFWPHTDNQVSAVEEAEKLLSQLGNLQYGQGDNVKSLYLQTGKLLAYAYDELDKVYRLIINNEDYRSALLRAAGLHEVLCRARLLILLHKAWLHITPRPTKQREAAKMLIKDLDMSNVGSLLTSGANSSLKIKGRRFDLSGSPSTLMPVPITVWQFDGVRATLLPQLRNRAIHFCLPVTPRLANACWKVAEENHKDFEKHWASYGADTSLRASYTTVTVDWESLCDACGVTFLPPDSKRN